MRASSESKQAIIIFVLGAGLRTFAFLLAEDARGVRAPAIEAVKDADEQHSSPVKSHPTHRGRSAPARVRVRAVPAALCI
ncbi:MAG: hypothetical protein JOZ10_00780 [Acidobacteria bacterium]|nr:hypothetical protein [Acidobacteriota bacterium]MBV9435308.1 hypothetical protein [Acidobacteriota bacterium]